MLLFVERGLAGSPQGALAFYPDPVFEFADIPRDTVIVCGISFGYEDKEAVINRVNMDRISVQDKTSFTC